MARGGLRVGSGRPKQSSRPVKKKLGGKMPACSGASVMGSSDMLPLDYMLAVMRDSQADEARRDKMAVAAAGYIHEKASEKKQGKKEQREEAAREADDVFSISRGKPKLVVDNS